MTTLLARWHALSPRARWWLLASVLVLLVVASSGIGIHNGFAYDDVYVIQKNNALHPVHGWWRLFGQSYWPRVYGADGYRPLTMLAFATEWAIGGGAPWVFHAANILLYVVTTVLVFWLAGLLMPLGAAWLVGALFAVHPVHVEAVANIVGQSELWVAVLILPAIGLYIHRRLSGRQLSIADGAAVCALYAAALFAKEHAIVLPALIVAVEMILVHDDRTIWRRLVAVRPLVLALTLIAVLYLAARSAVKGGDISGFLPFVPFHTLDLSYTNRVLTMIGAAPEWIRLLLWPARLSAEYAPPDVDIAQGPSLIQLPGLLLLIGILGLAVATWKRRGPGALASFGIAWFCLTLLPSSNFIVPAGILIAERTLFLPSVGAMLAVGSAAWWLADYASRVQPHGTPNRAYALGAFAIAAILSAGVWRSVTRTEVWFDNERLFFQEVVDAPQSYRANYMLGAWLFETGRKKQGEHYYRRALALFPYDPFMSYNFALQYQLAGMYAPAIPLYRWTFDIAPHFREGQGRANLAFCLANMKQFAEARDQAYLAMSYGGAPLSELRRIVQVSDSALRGPGAAGRAKGPLSFTGKTPAQSQIAGSSGTPNGGSGHLTRSKSTN
jgi:protein O-mannosyl-transferase